MSLVGTRPPTVDEWDKYELHHRARLATKPGLTGMWQVSGRSNITDLLRNGINFANANCHQFVKFIKVCGLDKDSVRCINQIFSFATFGMFYDEIKKLMKQEDYLEQYESIVTENSMDNYKSEFVSE